MRWYRAWSTSPNRWQGLSTSQEPAPDPRDDGVLACAVEGEAHYLVSSDPRLLDIGRYEEVCIVNPGQFLLAYNRPSCRRRR